jgi:hypothetical protein
MNSMIDWHEELGDSKFEHFVTLKWMLSDPHYLHRLVYPLLCSQWSLFTCADHMLPLGDSPILVSSTSTMVALLPKLLLEIYPAVRTKEDSLPLIQRINPEKFNEYRRRTIGNTFREIIGEQDVLDQLRVSSEFQARASLMKDVKKYNTMIVADGEREVWHLNAYGNANPSASSRGPEDA